MIESVDTEPLSNILMYLDAGGSWSNEPIQTDIDSSLNNQNFSVSCMAYAETFYDQNMARMTSALGISFHFGTETELFGRVTTQKVADDYDYCDNHRVIDNDYLLIWNDC